MGFFDPADEAVGADAVLAHFRDVTGWYVDDREVTIDKRWVAKVLIDFGDPRSEHWELMKRETMPADAMLARRMEALTLGVLGQLGATANWHRIAREWLFGEPPSTELGASEESFHVRAAAYACRAPDALAPAPLHGPQVRRRRRRLEGARRARESRQGDGGGWWQTMARSRSASGAAAARPTPTARSCARSSASSCRRRPPGRSTSG